MASCSVNESPPALHMDCLAGVWGGLQWKYNSCICLNFLYERTGRISLGITNRCVQGFGKVWAGC